jgi:hypothetical protein
MGLNLAVSCRAVLQAIGLLLMCMMILSHVPLMILTFDDRFVHCLSPIYQPLVGSSVVVGAISVFCM